MRTDGRFDPTVYRNKKQISLKTAYTGVRIIYKWCEIQKRYIQPKTGNKYFATIKQYGRQKEKYFERLEDARRWRVSGEGLKADAPKMIFGDVAEKFFLHIQSKVNPSTWKTYKNSTKHLEHFLKLPVSSITSFVVDQWLIKIKHPTYLSSQHQTRFTYTKELKVLKLILKYYSEYMDESYVMPVRQRHSKDAVIDLNKLKESRARNQSRYLSQEDQAAFFESLSAITSEKNRVFLYLAAFQLQTGTRIGEAAAIEWSDVDFLSGKVRISKCIHWGRGKEAMTYVQPFTKTGVSRYVPLTPSLKSLLMDLNQQSANGLIFSHDGNTPLPFRAIQYFYDKAYEGAGIKHRGTHILRHTFSTDFLTDTKDHIALSRLLGHSSTRQTEHYAKIKGTLIDQSFDDFKEGSEERLGKVLNF